MRFASYRLCFVPELLNIKFLNIGATYGLPGINERELLTPQLARIQLSVILPTAHSTLRNRELLGNILTAYRSQYQVRCLPQLPFNVAHKNLFLCRLRARIALIISSLAVFPEQKSKIVVKIRHFLCATLSESWYNQCNLWPFQSAQTSLSIIFQVNTNRVQSYWTFSVQIIISNKFVWVFVPAQCQSHRFLNFTNVV